ncbi:MAG TPA: dihydroorotase [Thermomicrobiales bacterium]|nr:dihydroorotase [Thermomicrobiales bacterium]
MVASQTWLIHGGRIIDPASGRDAVLDLTIRDGLITDVGVGLNPLGATEFDASGLIVAPGLIDMHVHLREPGFESKETIQSGTVAAAAGGFTGVCCMPNTSPALDSVAALHDLNERARRDGRVRVWPIAAITKGRQGAEAVDFAALTSAGAIGFSDDGDTTRDSAIMRAALEASRQLDVPIMVHCEDKALADGAMHEGEVSRELGIPGIPAEAEEIIIARDLMLAGLTGGWLHVCHVSTARGAELVRQAKRAGVRVTAEVMPHHLVMDAGWVAGRRRLLNTDEREGSLPSQIPDPQAKVNPPLRTEADTVALLAALQDGTFDIVATDHAPHAESEKSQSTFVCAAFGMGGLEVALPVMLALVRAGHLTLSDMIDKLSSRPARLLNLQLGTLESGSPADIMIFDPSEQWTVCRETLRSKSANTPLLGMEMEGRVRLTLVGGEERYRA